MDGRDHPTLMEELESLLQACHNILRHHKASLSEDVALADSLRETCRGIEARLQRMIDAA